MMQRRKKNIYKNCERGQNHGKSRSPKSSFSKIRKNGS